MSAGLPGAAVCNCLAHPLQLCTICYKPVAGGMRPPRTTERRHLTWRWAETTTRRDAAMDGTLAAADLERLHKDFSANPIYRFAQNSVTRVTVDDVAINREIVSSIDHSLSTTLDDWNLTSQQRSGRCWLFAGLNLLRAGVMNKTRIKDFELSQTHAML